MELRKRIYISGPISKGDRNHHLYQSLVVEQSLFEAGFATYNPIVSMQRPFNIPSPDMHKAYLENDFSWVYASHAVVRMPGESVGGDMETDFARENKIPVYRIPDVNDGTIADLVLTLQKDLLAQ